MADPRPPKKSDMIEVRVCYETKRDFLAACQRTGRTASDVVRASIDDFIRAQNPLPEPEPANDKLPFLRAIPKPMRRKRYLAAGAAVTGIALLVALPSAAAPGLDATFRDLDANSDGVLTIEEFSKKPAGMNQMSVRKLQQGGSAAASSEPPAVYIILPDADGAVAGQRREVRFQTVGGASAVPMEDRRREDFASYDANKDGKVDLDEYRARFRTMMGNGFARLDTDKSGSLDPKEYEAQSAPLLTIPVGSIADLGVAGKYGPLMTPEALDAAFKERDVNKDGKLTLEEYLPPA